MVVGDGCISIKSGILKQNFLPCVCVCVRARAGVRVRACVHVRARERRGGGFQTCGFNNCNFPQHGKCSSPSPCKRMVCEASGVVQCHKLAHWTKNLSYHVP